MTLYPIYKGGDFTFPVVSIDPQKEQDRDLLLRLSLEKRSHEIPYFW